MRKAILRVMITLDGYVTGSNNELYWITVEVEEDEDFLVFYDATVDTALMGYGCSG